MFCWHLLTVSEVSRLYRKEWWLQSCGELNIFFVSLQRQNKNGRVLTSPNNEWVGSKSETASPPFDNRVVTGEHCWQHKKKTACRVLSVENCLGKFFTRSVNFQQCTKCRHDFCWMCLGGKSLASQRFYLCWFCEWEKVMFDRDQCSLQIGKITAVNTMNAAVTKRIQTLQTSQCTLKPEKHSKNTSFTLKG